jgi:hypothetical protein
MKTIHVLLAISLAAILLIASGWQITRAVDSSGSGYALNWWSLDGGGNISQPGTGYAVSGTIAQPDAKKWRGEHYSLSGGLWQAQITQPESKLFLPLITR